MPPVGFEPKISAGERPGWPDGFISQPYAGYFFERTNKIHKNSKNWASGLVFTMPLYTVAAGSKQAATSDGKVDNTAAKDNRL